VEAIQGEATASCRLVREWILQRRDRRRRSAAASDSLREEQSHLASIRLGRLSNARTSSPPAASEGFGWAWGLVVCRVCLAPQLARDVELLHELSRAVPRSPSRWHVEAAEAEVRLAGSWRRRGA